MGDGWRDSQAREVRHGSEPLGSQGCPRASRGGKIIGEKQRRTVSTVGRGGGSRKAHARCRFISAGESGSPN